MVNEQPPSSAPSQVPPTAAAQGATAPTGQSLVDLVKGFEGYVDHAEWDYKQWTSGYGTRASGPDEKIDRPEAERRLAAELAKSAAAVDNDARRAGIALNENQRNALISFDYNTGSAAKVLAASGGDLAKVASGMADYIHAGGQVNNGLVERRRAEGALFNRPVSAASIQPPAPVPSAAAVQPEAGLAVRPGQRQPAQSVTTTTTTTAETHIGAVTIHTAATDARGIVRDFAGEVRRRSLALQANTGLT
jgi:GH24 family phage-related lysozyme (muramidase)